MTVRKIRSLLFALLVSTMLVGCGSEIPDLTDEQLELIADYSAALLMKYDSTSPSRLLPPGYDGADTVVYAEEAIPAEPEDVVYENTEPVITSDDLDVIDNTVVSETPASYGSFNDFVAGSGINIDYSYYEILDSYPGDTDNLYFATDASAGNKLLVIHFIMSSADGETHSVNMTEYGLKYRVILDVGEKKRAMTTMLGNDIVTFMGNVVPDQSLDLVAIAEISDEEAASFSTISFVIKGKDSSATMVLQ